MRFAIFGAGDQAAIHAQALRQMDNAELVGVVGKTASRAQSFARRFDLRVFDSAHQALTSDVVDAVIIASPTATHCDLACRALGAGKHVFCETPICLTCDEADRMIAASDNAGRLLRVGLVHRFDSEVRHLHDLARSRIYGVPLAVATSRLTPPFWLRPGEVLADRHHGDAIHELLAFDVDFLIWTFGEATALAAQSVGEPGYAGHVQASLKFDTIIGQAEASQLLPDAFPFSLETRITFERAFVHLQTVFGTDPMAAPEISYAIYGPGDAIERPDLLLQDPWRAQLQHFVESALTGKEASFASGRDGRNALALCLEIQNLLPT